MKTKNVLLSFLLFLALTACGESVPTENDPTESVIENTAADQNQPTSVPAPTFTSEPMREAVFTEIEGEVDYHLSVDLDFIATNLNDTLDVGGQVRTGVDGRTKLDLTPEGTIIRLSYETLFTLDELSSDPDTPITKIKLLLGDLWVILNGGELEIDTPSGIASVRGSMMGVGVNSESENVAVTCLEGHCIVSNQHGEVELQGGQAADLAPEHAPSEARPMTPKEFEHWREEVPEAHDVLEEAITHHPEGGTGEEGSFEGAVGFWTSTDTDGSHQNLTIQAKPGGGYAVHYIDHGATVCGTDANGPIYAAESEGTGKANENILSISSEIICLKNGGESIGTFAVTYTYDLASDTITDGWVTWHRSQ